MELRPDPRDDTSRPGDFTGPDALITLLLAQDETLPCLTRNLHAYAFGRPPDEADACRVGTLDRALADDDGRVLTLFERVLTDDTFHLRHREANR